MLRNLLTLFLLSLIPALATAQAAPTPQPQQAAPQHPASAWPILTSAMEYGSRNLDIVTTSQPGKRQHCHTHTLTPDSMICRSKPDAKEITFQKDDIAAIIEPRDFKQLRKSLPYFGITLAALGATIFGAVAIDTAITTFGFSVLAFLIFCVGGLSGMLEAEPTGSPHDTLLYQRPNTTLTVRLH